MNNIRELFIKNLKYFRKQKGINQLTLSTEIGKGVNYISNIETGIVFPPPETIDEIAEVLKIKSSQLFAEDSSPQNVIEQTRDELAEIIAEKVTNTIRTTIKMHVKSEVTKALKEI